MNLDPFIGHEHRLDETARALRTLTQSYRAPVVGAVHITCVDESESECAEAFSRGFVSDLLPALKFSRRSCFRVATAGGRYEWGGIRVAEPHFALAATRNAFKIIMVKVNAHVSVDESKTGPRFGIMQRYQEDSTYCGALHLLLEGCFAAPFVSDLSETFTSEGLDRVALLNDPGQVPKECKHLYASIIQARLQARRVILDIQDYTPTTPTLYIVAPCVTLNRPEMDTEILCGLYHADHRGRDRRVTYQGLSDDPRTYRFDYLHRRIAVRSDDCSQVRDARDHRELVSAAIPAMLPDAVDGKWSELVAKIRQGVAGEHAKPLLQASLLLLGEVAPVPAALVLFGSGATGIYTVYRAHRLAAEGAVDEGKAMIADVQKRLDHMSPEQAQAALAALAQHF